MDRNKLHEQLLATFVNELAEHVASINDGVIAMEAAETKAQGEESLTLLFRAAHSLKGAARAVDVPPIEQACHQLENVLTALREDRIQLIPPVASLLLQVADAVDGAGQLLRRRDTVPEDHFAALTQDLERAAAGNLVELEAAPTVSAEQPLAQPAPPAPVETSKTSQVETDTSSQTQRSLGATVRVAEDKLDGLMAQAGELLVARQQIEIRPAEMESVMEAASHCRAEFQSIQRILLYLIQRNEDPLLRRSARLSSRVEEIVEQTGVTLRDLEAQLQSLQHRLLTDSRQLNHAGQAIQEDIHRIRMVPFSDGCAGLARAVRDAAQTTGKTVDFVIEGGDIEIDRTVLQGLRDPLLHLVRNAVGHGLETPPERVAAGKPETGRITLSVSLRGSQVDIQIADDGRGIDRDAIIQRLDQQGLPQPADEHELLRTIFRPGFSTVDDVTDLSGRGVGMDVVKSELESLHGTIDLTTQPGFGTRINMSVPLTLTTISALFVEAAGQIFAIPSTNVSRLVRFRPDDLRSMNGKDVVSLGGSPLPVTTLATALGMPPQVVSTEKGHLVAVVLSTSDRQQIVIVDRLIGERDAVVKNLGTNIRRVRHVSGATLLRNGSVALLLNVASLMRTGSVTNLQAENIKTKTPKPQTLRRRIMVVDDSLTTRSMVKNILEAAGYDVVTAVDGQDAWSRLQGTRVELIVSDVDMPGMDGFELTSLIRRTPQFQALPVVLVTSRDSEQDKAKGVEVGADDYLIKSAFHQSNILDAIGQLL